MQATNELFVKAMHTTLNDLDTARCLYEKLDELVNAEEDPAQS